MTLLKNIVKIKFMLFMSDKLNLLENVLQYRYSTVFAFAPFLSPLECSRSSTITKLQFQRRTEYKAIKLYESLDSQINSLLFTPLVPYCFQ